MADIPADISTETDRVLFIKAMAEFMVMWFSVCCFLFNIFFWSVVMSYFFVVVVVLGK